LQTIGYNQFLLRALPAFCGAKTGFLAFAVEIS